MTEAITAALITTAAIAVAAVMWRANRQKDAKLRLLLEALKNGDTSLRFSTSRSVNRTLNHIADILGAMSRRAEQADRYYGLILDQTETGIIVAGANGTIRTCNAAALRLLGLKTLTHVSQLARIDPSLPDAFDSAEPGQRNTICSRLGLTLRESCLRIDGGELRIFAITDISHELEAREIGAWEQLSRTLAHEIMNSIAPVISLSDTLLSLPPECHSERVEGLRAIGDTSRSLLQFVKSYRSVEYAPSPCISKVTVVDVLRHTSTLFPQMKWSAPADMTVAADETMLCRVLFNLCTNALQAGAQTITVTASDNIIEVANDGDPIAPELADDIFTPFFSTRDDGSGIGLILSRRIMTSFGGSLTLQRLSSPVIFRLSFRGHFSSVRHTKRACHNSSPLSDKPL